MEDAAAGSKRRAEDVKNGEAIAKVARPPPASTMVVLPHLKAYYSAYVHYYVMIAFSCGFIPKSVLLTCRVVVSL